MSAVESEINTYRKATEGLMRRSYWFKRAALFFGVAIGVLLLAGDARHRK